MPLITSPNNARPMRLLERIGFGHERRIALSEGEPGVEPFAHPIRT